jgi:pimeloyl-ACP methyl ester carboxylesterase
MPTSIRSSDPVDLTWDLVESIPPRADHTVLLLAGGLISAAFYREVLDQPLLADRSIRVVAATVPGFAGSQPPAEFSIESFAREGARLATRLGALVVAGHSLGANVAIEMAAQGLFDGPLVLLAPTFSSEDEVAALRTLDRLGRLPVVGRLVWRIALRVVPGSLAAEFPAGRRDELVAVMRRNDPSFCRRSLRLNFEYFDDHRSVVGRLSLSGVEAWVIRGRDDDVVISPSERAVLAATHSVHLIEVDGAGHFLNFEHPEQVAELIAGAVATTVPSAAAVG